MARAILALKLLAATILLWLVGVAAFAISMGGQR